MRVEQIMSRTVISLRPDATVATARAIFRQRNIHHLVVTDGRKVIGTLSYRELSGHGEETPVSATMNRDFITATPSTTLKEAASLMLRHAAGCLPVVDEGIVGILTTTDLMRNLAGADS